MRLEPKKSENYSLTFKTFIGVDQTGRRLPSGKAAPLPACVLTAGEDGIWLVAENDSGKPLWLKSLCPSEVGELVRVANPLPVALVLDCVFGLPNEVRELHSLCAHPRYILERLRDQPVGNGDFGREAARRFFYELWPTASIPARRVEMIAGSNSVFQQHPFQKNIQTGTFRMWKEIARYFDFSECGFWPWDTSESAIGRRFWFFEGYPSFFWRTLFQLEKRNPALLVQRLAAIAGLKVIGARTIESRPDHADAAVLAVGAWMLQCQQRLWSACTNASALRQQDEGWILGVSDVAG